MGLLYSSVYYKRWLTSLSEATIPPSPQRNPSTNSRSVSKRSVWVYKILRSPPAAVGETVRPNPAASTRSRLSHGARRYVETRFVLDSHPLAPK